MILDPLTCAILADLSYATPTGIPQDVFVGVPCLDLEAAFFLESNEDAELYTLILPSAIVFLCRGTESMRDVKTDLMVLKTKFPELQGAKVHRGFSRQFMSIRGTIMKHVLAFAFAGGLAGGLACGQRTTVLFVGHSLGGALATLGAAAVKSNFPHLFVECTTFGCPRVGNRAFASWFNDHIDAHDRYVMGNDVVPRMPRINYSHVGNERSLGPPSRMGCFWRLVGDVRDHLMTSYIDALRARTTETTPLLLS